MVSFVYNPWAPLWQSQSDSASVSARTNSDTVSLCDEDLADRPSGKRFKEAAALPQVPTPPPAIQSTEDLATPPPAVQPSEWMGDWNVSQGSHELWSGDVGAWAEMDLQTAVHMAFQWGQAHGMSIASDIAFQHQHRPREPGSALDLLRRQGDQVQRSLGDTALQEDTESISSESACGKSALCQVIWCDQRAFKTASAPLKASLEDRIGQSVKAHKSADKCLRFLRKKQHVQGRPPCVFLLSFSNAPQLLEQFDTLQHLVKGVVVLVDRSRNTVEEAREKLGGLYRHAIFVSSWPEAADAVHSAVHA